MSGVRLVGVLTLAATWLALAPAHATEGSRGDRAHWSVQGGQHPPPYTNKPTSFDVTIGECFGGFRVVTFSNVVIFGKSPARFPSDGATVRIPCGTAGGKTALTTVLSDDLDAAGNPIPGMTVRTTIAVNFTEPQGTGTGVQIDTTTFAVHEADSADIIFEIGGDGLTPDRMK